MTAPHPYSLLPGYVLEDLGAQALEEVELHLLGCASCRMEVARLRDAMYSLADDLPYLAPPSGTWSRIQARRQTGPAHLELPPLVPKSKDSRLKGRWWAAAVAVTLLVGTVTPRVLPAVSRQVQVQRWEAQGATRLSLRSQDGQVFGALLVHPEGRALVVLTQPPPQGQAYQAWGRLADGPRANVPVSLGLTEGTVLQVDWRGYALVGISLEPHGGSSAPTRPLGRVKVPGV
ncbi:anti-sigma factor domain-containing protein [Deinococcus hopiensis]|uniref:Regulator of SigK n=1 Tax=Deinococcus hopiensis KR-140 TaxID=695939 RepID=A0A1W1UTL8_9DEIO|nr:anti-sigma factor [Deinococcus hopiensis]SMB84475.1 Anti-sigma-K factor RskA [Deinococcus hopiensis KR-140]